MASKTRDSRIIAAVACPICEAATREPCRAPSGQTLRRCHASRRAAWQQWRRANEVTPVHFSDCEGSRPVGRVIAERVTYDDAFPLLRPGRFLALDDVGSGHVPEGERYYVFEEDRKRPAR